MKTFLILLSLSAFALANELSWVDEQIDAIKPNRHGVSNAKISKIGRTFVYLKKNQPKKSKSSKSSNKTSPIRTSSTSSSTSNSSTSSSSENPVVTSITTPNSVLTLNAIINSVALINDDWYNLGDTLHGYKVVKIGKTSVTLVKKKKTTVLSTKSSTNKLKFK